jgi:hypothetical protein
VPVVRLTEVFRQAAQSRIITSAHRINYVSRQHRSAIHFDRPLIDKTPTSLGGTRYSQTHLRSAR